MTLWEILAGRRKRRSCAWGPDRGAFELHPGNTNQGETVAATVILLPWKGEIREAFNVQTESSVPGDCGDGNECADKNGEISFVRGDNPDYDDLVLTISGTGTSAKTGEGRPSAQRADVEICGWEVRARREVEEDASPFASGFWGLLFETRWC